MIEKIKSKIKEADAIVIGAGAGLSTASGFVYTGKRFKKYFNDFSKNYNLHDMYSGGFYPYATLEEYWAYWSRFIYINRYIDAPKPVYNTLYELIKNKDYFVLTTNVDHYFQKAGFNKHRLFYTQGDYGLLQCSKPCNKKTYDNKEVIQKMVLSQGFIIDKKGKLSVPSNNELKMTIPSDLIPICPHCGKPMSMNLRSDDTFIQDDGWYRAAQRYELFVKDHKNLKTLYLEIGVGYNTPSIIKYNFWHQVKQNPKATYICLNVDTTYVPYEIANRSICISCDVEH